MSDNSPKQVNPSGGTTPESMVESAESVASSESAEFVINEPLADEGAGQGGAVGGQPDISHTLNNIQLKVDDLAERLTKTDSKTKAQLADKINSLLTACRTMCIEERKLQEMRKSQEAQEDNRRRYEEANRLKYKKFFNMIDGYDREHKNVDRDMRVLLDKVRHQRHKIDNTISSIENMKSDIASKSPTRKEMLDTLRAIKNTL